jgi:hypothetical protein
MERGKCRKTEVHFRKKNTGRFVTTTVNASEESGAREA